MIAHHTEDARVTDRLDGERSRTEGELSVGLIERARQAELAVESLPPVGAAQLFEITLEPEAGSPIGRPTGPILFKGLTVRVL